MMMSLQSGHLFQRAVLLGTLCAFLFCLAVPPDLYADGHSTGDILDSDGTGFADDFGEVFSFPVNFDGSDWLLTGAVIGGAVVSALWIDEPLKERVTSRRTPFLDGLSSLGDVYGRFRTGYYLGAALYLGGLAADDEWTRLTGRAVIEAHTFSLLVTGALKAVAGRSRPYTGDGNMRFNWFEDENRRWSFPSGHTTAAFAISSVLSRRIDNPWATAGLYALSCVTMFNRLYDDKHWLSDTIIGAAVGTAVGLAVGSLVNDEEDSRKVTGDLQSQQPVQVVTIPLISF